MRWDGDGDCEMGYAMLYSAKSYLDYLSYRDNFCMIKRVFVFEGKWKEIVLERLIVYRAR